MDENENQTTEEPKERRLRDRVLEGLEWMRTELTKFFRVGRLKYDTTSLQRERTALYQELGKKIFELMKQETIDTEPLKPMTERIESLTVRIEEQQYAIGSLVRTHNDTKAPPPQI